MNEIKYNGNGISNLKINDSTNNDKRLQYILLEMYRAKWMNERDEREWEIESSKSFSVNRTLDNWQVQVKEKSCLCCASARRNAESTKTVGTHYTVRQCSVLCTLYSVLCAMIHDASADGIIVFLLLRWENAAMVLYTKNIYYVCSVLKMIALWFMPSGLNPLIEKHIHSHTWAHTTKHPSTDYIYHRYINYGGLFI